MEVKWDIEEIKKYKSPCEALLRRHISETEKEEIKRSIENLKAMEKVLKTGRTPLPKKVHMKYQDQGKLLPQDTYREFQTIHPKIQKLMIKAAQNSLNIEDTYDNIELPRLNISKDELLDMAHDFARFIPDKNYLKEVEKYIDEKRHLIHFAKPINPDEMGITYYMYQPNYRPYVLINSFNTIEDFSTLNHELAHCVFGRKDSSSYIYSNHFYLTELEGSFFDFLTTKYLEGKQSNQVLVELEYGRTIGKLNDLIDFYLTSSAIKLYQKTGKITQEAIHKRIMKDNLDINLNEGILITSLEEYPKKSAKYTISYLTSLDLENIYEDDPEYAFYLMKRIRNNKTENIFENLRENSITFMNDNYQNLKQKVKTC